MKIAFFCPKLISKGGAEVYLSKISSLLSKKHEVKVYTLAYDKNVFPEIKDITIELGHPLLLRKFNSLRNSTLMNINAMRYVRKKIPKNYDLYNVHIFPSNFIKLNKPVIWTAQEPPRMIYDLYKDTLSELTSLKRIVAIIYFRILRYFDAYNTKKNVNKIIVNSNYSKTYIKNVYEMDSEVIYPGIDKKFLLKSKTKKDNNLIISVGRLFSSKRFDLIIKSFKIALEKKPDLKLVIIGNGPEMNNLNKLTTKLGINNNVTFTGEVSDNELINYYNKAKITIYIPLREMFGIVALESAAAGTPVIGVNDGGYTELLNDCVEFVKPDPKIIAKSIIKLLNNKIIYNNLSRKGRNIAKNYTWELVVSKTEKFFTELLSKK